MEKKTTQSALLVTNSGTPSNQYNSGSGFFYQRYALTGISPQTISKFKSMMEQSLLDSANLL